MHLYTFNRFKCSNARKGGSNFKEKVKKSRAYKNYGMLVKDERDLVHSIERQLK